MRISQARILEWIVHSLLQGIYSIQGSNPHILHCRWILYQLSHEGSPRLLEWVTYPFSRGSSRPRSQTGVSGIADGFFTNWAAMEALLLQGIFPIQGSNPCLLHWQADSLPLCHLVSPKWPLAKPHFLQKYLQISLATILVRTCSIRILSNSARCYYENPPMFRDLPKVEHGSSSINFTLLILARKTAWFSKYNSCLNMLKIIMSLFSSLHSK